MMAIVTHTCSTCKFHKQMLGIKAEPDDALVYSRIQTQITNTQQAASPLSLAGLPESVTAEDKRIYMETAMKNYNDAQELLAEWWREMIRKYNVPQTSKFDNVLGEFYECVDENGVPDQNGQYIEREAK